LGFFEFFLFSRNEIFIFGGFELGLEKMLAGQMTGAEWVGKKYGIWSQIGQLGSVGFAKGLAVELNRHGQRAQDRAFLVGRAKYVRVPFEFARVPLNLLWR